MIKPVLFWSYTAADGKVYGNSIIAHLPLDPDVLAAFKRDIEEVLGGIRT